MLYNHWLIVLEHFTQKYKDLSNLTINQTVKILNIHGSSEQKRRLESMGFIVGTKTTFLNRAPFKGSMCFEIENNVVVLSEVFANLIEIE